MARIYYIPDRHWEEFSELLRKDTLATYRINRYGSSDLVLSNHIRFNDDGSYERIAKEGMRHRVCYQVGPLFLATAKLLSNNPEALHQWLLGN